MRNVNSVQRLIDQQTGAAPWRCTDIPLKRLQCPNEDCYTHLYTDNNDLVYHDTPIFACKFSTQQQSSHVVALANEDGKLALHNVLTKDRQHVQAHNNAIFDLAWMFNEMKLVTASGDHTTKLYDAGNGEMREERLFLGHTRSVKTVAFRHFDPHVFASGGRDGNIIIWDKRAKFNSNIISKPDRIIHMSHMINQKKGAKNAKSVTGLAFQNEMSLISCAAGDGLIKIWDLRKNYLTYKRRSLPKHVIPYTGSSTRNGYSSLIINDYSPILYASCLDNTIYSYNISTYNPEPIMKYKGHTNSTFYIKSTLDKTGDYLMSGSSDENAYIWNTKHEKPLVKLTGHNAEVTCVAWCNKYDVLLTCSDDMSHMFWTVAPDYQTYEKEIDVRGRAEILPDFTLTFRKNSKRSLSDNDDDDNVGIKHTINECLQCKKPSVNTFCFDCTRVATKRVLSQRNDDNCHEPDLKKIKLNCDDDDNCDDFEPRKKFAKLDLTDLPNFVKDGLAPHLNFSPPKKKCQDWLTKLRTEKRIKSGDKFESYVTTFNSSPTSNKKVTKTRGLNSSPILKYFKVTNSVLSCNNINNKLNIQEDVMALSLPSCSKQSDN